MRFAPKRSLNQVKRVGLKSVDLGKFDRVNLVLRMGIVQRPSSNYLINQMHLLLPAFLRAGQFLIRSSFSSRIGTKWICLRSRPSVPLNSILSSSQPQRHKKRSSRNARHRFLSQNLPHVEFRGGCHATGQA
jgi:hypothetical protein